MEQEFNDKAQTKTQEQGMCRNCGAVGLPHTCPRNGVEYVKIKPGFGGGI